MTFYVDKTSRRFQMERPFFIGSIKFNDSSQIFLSHRRTYEKKYESIPPCQ